MGEAITQGKGSRQGAKAGAKGRMTERRMKWIIDVRPSWDVDMNEMWWGWLKGLGLWDTGLDARSCGLGLSWGSVRRCCPVLGNLDSLTCPFDWVDKSTCETHSMVSN